MYISGALFEKNQLFVAFEVVINRETLTSSRKTGSATHSITDSRGGERLPARGLGEEV
jgi:hypothetical protein